MKGRFAWFVFALAVLVHLGSANHFFVSDDFLNMERNIILTLGEGVSLFSTSDVDFYRPIPRLHFGLLQGFVGDRAVVWNIVGMLLHGIASVLAFLLARDLLGRTRETAARWAGVLFAVHFIHVEPVLWASGVTTTYVTLFLFAAIRWHRRSRQTRRARDLAFSVLAFTAALLSKETAIAFVPLWLLTLWAWPVRDGKGSAFPRFPTIAEAVPYALVLGAYLLIVTGIDRGGDASPYQLAVGPHVVKNFLFFLVGDFVPVRYWEVQALWAASPGMGAFLTALVTRPLLLGPMLLGGLALASAALRGGRDIRFGFLWIAAAALPFLLLPGSGERFLYLSSFGACLVLALGIQVAEARIGTGANRLLVGAIVAAIFVAGSLDRQRDWDVAASWTRSILARGSYIQARGESERIEFVGIPGSHRSAWVFRNGFGAMVRLYWGGTACWRAEEAASEGPPDTYMDVRLSPAGAVLMAPREAVNPPPTGP